MNSLKIWFSRDLQLIMLKTKFKPWADSKGIIRRAWVFGSRAKGKSKPDSDLDIAIQTLSSKKSVIINIDIWKQELKSLLDVEFEVNIHPYVNKEQTPKVDYGLKSGSYKIYEYNLPTGIEDAGVNI